MSDDRDKYGVKTLEIGEERFIPDAIPVQFHRYMAIMRKRHEILSTRKYKVWDVFGGVRVRRIS